ncbi:hypothetical protein M622_18045 [Thauera terpenica 58Eu]|uniref:Uncharacterized protein n=1 Tax=Thauera terpenica 58Eu TaxID=1348657 RepID=T0AVR1_9RHOO|nr:hypothetical protein M622_18045 [Thauera terpenica 58Eu]
MAHSARDTAQIDVDRAGILPAPVQGVGEGARLAVLRADEGGQVLEEDKLRK